MNLSEPLIIRKYQKEVIEKYFISNKSLDHALDHIKIE